MAPGIDRKSRMLVMTAIGANPVAVVRLSGLVRLRLSTATPSSPSASIPSRSSDRGTPGGKSLVFDGIWRRRVGARRKFQLRLRGHSALHQGAYALNAEREATMAARTSGITKTRARKRQLACSTQEAWHTERRIEDSFASRARPSEKIYAIDQSTRQFKHSLNGNSGIDSQCLRCQAVIASSDCEWSLLEYEWRHVCEQ
jgi:hypothetical protein